MANGVCTACNKGELVRTQVRRMHAVLVVIGFILFVPATIGVLAGGIGAIGSSIFASQAKRTPDDVRSELHDLSVPDPLIDRVLAGELDPRVDFKGMNQQQQSALLKGHLAVIGKQAPTEQMVGWSVAVLAASLVAGVVAWLFIRKKWVLRCSECEAVAA